MLLTIAFLMFSMLIAAWLFAPDVREDSLSTEHGTPDVPSSPVHA